VKQKALELLRLLDRVQKGLRFRLVASGVVGVIVLAVVIWALTISGAETVETLDLPTAEQLQTIESEDVRRFNEQLIERTLSFASNQDMTQVVLMAALVVGALWLVVIWLGLGLTYIALMLIAGLVIAPLSALGFGDWARLLGGITVLAAAFTALLEAVRLGLDALPGSVFAIARNVLSEAVRNKVSVVFIVLLIILLATIPGSLQETQFLRYKVQNFLSYGMRGAFWLTAFLVVLFSVTTVTSEQRQRVIWQTMTKPVAAWQYILGKWIGVSALGLVLICVSSVAIFLFTEDMRRDTAYGERSPYVAAADPRFPTEDRKILHYQVLQARVSKEADVPIARYDEQFEGMVDTYIENLKVANEDFRETPDARREVADDLYKNLILTTRTIAPTSSGEFWFTGLDEARNRNVPLMLRYLIKAGGNRPDQIYTLTFQIGPLPPQTEQCGLDSIFVINDIPPQAIDSEGRLRVVIWNGDLQRQIPNPQAIHFPPEGLEVSYSVGGYQLNFLRVVAVMGAKLAFLGMLGVVTGTFLSFPVASLVSLGVFFTAQTAGFLSESVEYYMSGPEEGLARGIQLIAGPISQAVAWIFETYANLQPEERLVEGRLVPWIGGGENPGVLVGVALLGTWTIVLYFVGAAIMKRRELAIYSGQ